MDSVGCSDDTNSKSPDNVQDKAKLLIANKNCHGICKVIPHSQFVVVHSSCRLPQNVMIRVIGHPQRVNSSPQTKVEIKKQLNEMLTVLNLILQRANFLKEQSLSFLEHSSIDSDPAPSSHEGDEYCSM